MSLEQVQEFPSDFHAGIAMLLLGEKKPDKILIVMDEDGKFGFPGGRVDKKDKNSAMVCIEREFKEEMGEKELPTTEEIGKFVWTTRAGIKTAIYLGWKKGAANFAFDNGDGELVGFMVMKLGMLERNITAEGWFRHVAVGSTIAILRWMLAHGIKWDPVLTFRKLNIHKKREKKDADGTK
jgi:NUDIX domain